MQNKIHVLADILMNRIAAGEVVERPASVAKELLENSIDAGATDISLFVKDGGTGLIQVMDNGEGMTETDVRLCCERHATSKLTCVEDLDAIHTLGFRGEALASIASVSRMSIVAKTDDDLEAHELIIENGVSRELRKTGAPRGCNISVKDLFANVPARRKFLKTRATELRYIIRTFRRLAFAHPHIAFSLYIDGQRTMQLKSGTQEDRIRDILGTQVFTRMVHVEKEMGQVRIHGFISRPGEGRRSRDDQFLFLNQRYIVNKNLNYAISASYGTRLGRDEYPIYILFVEMDPAQYDVNVHPMKIEVRFLDDRFLHSVMRRAVQEGLNQSEVIPHLHLVPGRRQFEQSFRPQPQTPSELGQLSLEVQRPLFEEPHLEVAAPRQTVSIREVPEFWQLHKRYILSPIKSGLTIIDQHVAHERILYERALRAREAQGSLSQQLLFPKTVQMSSEDYLALMEMLPQLEKIGFGIKEFGKNTVVLEAVPVEVKTGEESDLLLEMIDHFKENKTRDTEIWHAVAASFACKAAIKSGDKLSQAEMASLVDQLFATQEPYFCPHGRPVVVNLTLDEFDKRFGR